MATKLETRVAVTEDAEFAFFQIEDSDTQWITE